MQQYKQKREMQFLVKPFLVRRSRTRNQQPKGAQTMKTLSTLALIATCNLALAAAPVVCKVEVDRGTLPADRTERAVVKVSLTAPEIVRQTDRPPVNLAIVLDRSGSMSGDKIRNAQDAAIEALRHLGSSDMYSLVVYNHNVETLVPAQSASNMDYIESRIREIHANGNTALFSGVSQGATELRKNLAENYVHRVILLSDGLANVGPSSPHELGRLGSSLLKENIAVSTVGVGTDYNEDLMTRLSQNSDGNAYFVQNSDDLPAIFAEELGDVLSIMARRVKIEIEFDNGVRPVRIIGRDGRIGDHNVEIQLNQLYGGQEKYALVEVEIPAQTAGSTLQLATANCVYEDVLDQAERQTKAAVSANFSATKEDVVKSVNVAVQRDLARNELAATQDYAVELADQGKAPEAARELKKKAEEIKERAQLYDIELDDEVAELETQSETLEEAGSMDKVMRKSFRTNSYQIRNQQQ
jgi:Ca-activated chloride channel family protein